MHRHSRKSIFTVISTDWRGRGCSLEMLPGFMHRNNINSILTVINTDCWGSRHTLEMLPGFMHRNSINSILTVINTDCWGSRSTYLGDIAGLYAQKQHKIYPSNTLITIIIIIYWVGIYHISPWKCCKVLHAWNQHELHLNSNKHWLHRGSGPYPEDICRAL